MESEASGSNGGEGMGSAGGRGTATRAANAEGGCEADVVNGRG